MPNSREADLAVAEVLHAIAYEMRVDRAKAQAKKPTSEGHKNWLNGQVLCLNKWIASMERRAHARKRRFSRARQQSIRRNQKAKP